jgi:cytochrome c553
MRWIRRIGLGLIGLFILLVLGGGYVYSRVEAKMTEFHPTHYFAAPVPSDAATIARGWHLARTRGCTDCHGADLQGQWLNDGTPWFVARLVAPNIALLAKQESPEKLEAAIRQGIRHDGRALVLMPSDMFANLSDGDTAALIALLRSLPTREHPLPRPYLGPLAYWLIYNASPQTQTAPELVANRGQLSRQADADPLIRLGEYTAMTSCSECHGSDLHGRPATAPGQPSPPDLTGARGYAKADFVRLMRTGVPVGGRRLAPLMRMAAQGRFANFTDQEVGAVYAYLNTLQPAPE